MMKKQFFRFISKLLPLFIFILISGCNSIDVLNPKGHIGSEERTLIVTAALLMLLVIIPAIGMTFVFAWKYRISNKKAKYAPEWAHSNVIEAVIWIVPAIIIVILSVLVWITSHTLDPYRPLDSKVKPITIQVVSLDWKWLFIYPKQNIATINQIVFPANVPIHFLITSDTVMNSFFIPQLGSQIMTMAGMKTQLHLIANEPGTYDGISANYSGHGFSHMTFKAIATSEQQYEAWLKEVRRSPKILDSTAFEKLAKPSSNNPVEYFSLVKPNLFQDIIQKYSHSMHMKPHPEE